jgi:hypothetical protein
MSRDLDPIKIIERAEHLVRYLGATWKRGRPGSADGKPVIPLLAAEFGVSERWIRDCLRRGKMNRRLASQRSTPMPMSQGMSKAYAAAVTNRPANAPIHRPAASVSIDRASAAAVPIALIPPEPSAAQVIETSVDGILRTALQRYVATSPTRTRETVALVLELLERLPKNRK